MDGHRLDKLAAGLGDVAGLPADYIRMGRQQPDDPGHPIQPGCDAVPRICPRIDGRRCDHALRPIRSQQPIIQRRVGGIAADQDMIAQLPGVAGLGFRPARVLDFLLFGSGIEIVLNRLMGIAAIKEGVNLPGIEAGKGYVEGLGVEVGHDGGQLVLVPIALDFVERDVERLFPGEVEIDHDAINLGLPHFQQHL